MSAITMLKTTDVVFAEGMFMPSKLLATDRFNRPLHSAGTIAAARGRGHREIRWHASRVKQSGDSK